jgi:shikimate dehydrogenase
MPRLGVLGWPVAHSLSPAMHNAAFAALGMEDWRYQLLPVPPEAFEETVRALHAAGFAGANVTIPHKEAALALADEASDAAAAIGAANTLSFDGTGIRADNTDAPGFLSALGSSPAGKSALVLGAGGAARAVVWALREAGARRVAVWNRTPHRAEALAAQLGADAVGSAEPADLLVNCTASGLDVRPTQFKDLPVSADGLGEYATVVDMVYRPEPTALIAAAAEAGCTTVDGLEVLIGQGAASFTTWTGREAPITAMREGTRGGPSGRHDPR